MPRGIYARPSAEERFWANVDRRGPDECWPWLGSEDRGYGKLWVDGRNVRATHFSWELVNGPMPADKVGRHTCDNPPCVNPNHIVPGSQLENMRDKVLRQRQAKGERNGAAKLTPEIVTRIRSEYVSRARGKASLRVLAKRYGIDPSTVHDIVNRRLWKECA
jgi:hypothetical protein